MTTLRMEVEAVQSAQTNMQNTKQQLDQLLATMSNTVTGLQSNWMGNSATEFLSLYDQWKSGMNTSLENLAQMASRLQNEINEWNQMASKLS